MSKGKIDGTILKKYNSLVEAKSDASPYLSWSYYEKDIYVDGDIINRDFVAAVAEEVAVREKYGLNTELESLDLLYKKLLNEVRENDFLNTHIYPKDIPFKYYLSYVPLATSQTLYCSLMQETFYHLLKYL